MRNDAKVKPMAKCPNADTPMVKQPVLWTPWGPQTFAERDAQLGAARNRGRLRKLQRPRQLTLVRSPR